MPMSWITHPIFLVAFSAVLGLGATYLSEHIRRGTDRRDRREHAKQLLCAIAQEVQEGVTRSQHLVDFLAQGRESYSRIYTALWDSAIVEVSKYIHDLEAPEILNLLDSIYCRFDLINFNMDREKFGNGAAFAKQYLGEMQGNLSTLRARLSELHIDLGACQ